MYGKTVPAGLALAVVALIAIAAVAVGGPSNDGRALADAASSAATAKAENVTIYMSVESRTGGTIEGDVTVKGLEGWIEVMGYEHEVVSPRDAASGLPTGKRQHKPFTITKPIDKSSPLLMQSLVNNENLPKVTLQFYRPSRTGKTQQYYTVVLTNASIAGIHAERPHDEAGHPLEEVSFTYQKIEWTWVDGGITAQDDWETPVS